MHHLRSSLVVARACHWLANARDLRGDAVPDHRDRAFAVGAADQMHGVAGGVGRLRRRIGDAAQSQGQPVAHLLGDGDDLRLLRRQLERRGLADDGVAACAILLGDLLDRLVDGQHAHVVEDRLGHVFGTAGARRSLVDSPGHDDVDVVVGQDEAAGAGIGRDPDGDGALALRQDGRHEAAIGADQLGVADRLAGIEAGAGDGADDGRLGLARDRR